MPPTWEERVQLYITHLISRGVQSRTIKSYLSGIKDTLSEDGYEWKNQKFLLNALTRACKLQNDRVKNRFPIQIGLLNLILTEVSNIFNNDVKQQPYLEKLYQCIFSLAYYGLLRISEIAGIHAVRAGDLHVARNKEKIMIVLYTSKTHGRGSEPQEIKITKLAKFSGQLEQRHSPFEISAKYGELRGEYDNETDRFFTFRNNEPITPSHVRKVLRKCLRNLGLNPKFYNTHSFRIGRATDLMKFKVPISRIKILGRWKSNTVFNYIKS